MSKKNRKLQNDEKTKEELLENIEIRKTSYSDASEIIRIMQGVFNIPSDREMLRQLLYSKANLDESVKIVDKRDGKIYGLLIFSEYTINEGSPLPMINHIMSDYLRGLNLVNGFAFVLDSRLSGTNCDKKTLLFNKDYLMNYDFIWCAVDNNLITHNYWKRLGFIELFNIREAVFYIKNMRKNDMRDIFILKALTHEKDNN